MDLEALLTRQRDNFKADITELINQATASLKTSVDSLGEQLKTFNDRLTKTETTVGENFTKLTKMEADVKSLQSQIKMLREQVDDLENRSRRSNLRIINIPEGSETGQDPTKLISAMLMEICPGVFNNPPELERAHRSPGPRPGDAGRPQAFIVKFLRYQEKEQALRWARQHKLRMYPDISAALAKKRAAFNGVKSSLYRK